MRSLSLICAWLLILAGFAARAAAEPPDPPQNLPIGELPSACYEEVASERVTCENDVIYYLNKNRAAMGLAPYALPQDFTALSPDRQIFILSNLDRIAYGLRPVPGLNSTLSAASLDGVYRRDDPTAPSSLSTGTVLSWAANWAGGFENVPYAYNMWMFDDCPEDPECWGHRHNVLIEFVDKGAANLAMGAATGRERRGEAGYAQLITTSTGPTPDYYYTWAEAQADGAGTYPYDPGVPQLDNRRQPLVPRLVLTVRRRGGRPVALRIGGSPALLGRTAIVTLTRERKVCRLRAACHWARAGKRRTRRLVLNATSEISIPRLRNGERLAIHARTRPFLRAEQHVQAATASITVKVRRT